MDGEDGHHPSTLTRFGFPFQHCARRSPGFPEGSLPDAVRIALVHNCCRALSASALNQSGNAPRSAYAWTSASVIRSNHCVKAVFSVSTDWRTLCLRSGPQAPLRPAHCPRAPFPRASRRCLPRWLGPRGRPARVPPARPGTLARTHPFLASRPDCALSLLSPPRLTVGHAFAPVRFVPVLRHIFPPSPHGLAPPARRFPPLNRFAGNPPH
jgi:hypothetical protein